MKKTIRLASSIVFIFLCSGYLLVELDWAVSGSGPRRKVKPRFYEDVLGDLEPRLHTVDRTAEGLTYTVTTNAQGFRGVREVAPEKPEGTVRILCLGDSYSYGVGVNDDRTFPALLESALLARYPGVKIEAVNAAVPFYDVFDELDYYRDKGRKLDPDVVVVQFYANDLEAMAGRFFRETNKAALGGGYDRLARATHIEEISDLLRRAAPGLFSGAAQGYGPPGNVQPGHSTAYGRFHIKATPAEWALLNDRDALLDGKNAGKLSRFWTNYEQGLLLLRNEVLAGGGRFLFIILPDPRQIFEYRNAPSAALVPFLEENGVPFLDFGQLFREYGHKGGERFFLTPPNGHLSELGNTLAAKVVGDSIAISQGKDGEPTASVDVKERFFGFQSPVYARMDITENGVRQVSGQKEVTVGVVEEKGLGVIREQFPEGDVFNLAAADPQAPHGGEIVLRADAVRPLARLDVILFRRIFHPAGGGVRLSWSLDGKRFTQVSSYVNRPDKGPDGLENIRIDAIPLEEAAPKTVYLKLELSGLARVFTQQRDDPERRLELVFYPVEKAGNQERRKP